MTFEEFQSLCASVVASGTADARPSPIYIGDQAAPTIGWYGVLDTPLVIVKEQLPNAAMLAILRSCRFSFDQLNNQTVISPITTVNA
jgi:hypothetical protein